GHDAHDGLARDVTPTAVGAARLSDPSRERERRLAFSYRRRGSHSPRERRAHSASDAASHPPSWPALPHRRRGWSSDASSLLEGYSPGPSRFDSRPARRDDESRNMDAALPHRRTHGEWDAHDVRRGPLTRRPGYHSPAFPTTDAISFAGS